MNAKSAILSAYGEYSCVWGVPELDWIMMNTKENRLDPSLLEPGRLDGLVKLLSSSRHPALVDEQGNRLDLPKPIYTQLLRVLKMMDEGRAIVMLPEDEAFTTQAAANFLGVSRQHLVDLLEKGEIAFHKVGSHRRIYFKDLLTYEQSRSQKRRKGLSDLTKKVSEAGLYDTSYEGAD